MRRRHHAFAADLGALGATLLVVGVAFAAWRASGHVRDGLRRDAGADTAPSREREPRTRDGGAQVESAELATATAPPTRPSRTFNVILITVDTLRFDLGFMGYRRPVSPNIDALASRSIVYERAYATASYTPKSLGPFLIGRYASETYRDGEHYTTFYPANVFVAERIQAAGGRTFGAACHHYFRWNKGFDQGFDVWDTSAVPPDPKDNDPSVTSDRLSDAALALLASPRPSEIPVRARWQSGRGATAKDGQAAGRFFAWFHYLDPHQPYVPHEGAPSFASMGGTEIPRERAAYDGEVWYTDRHVGRVLDHVAAQPWANETAIVFTADHGEAFGERGHWKHGRELWEPLVRVPLLVFIPGIAPRRLGVKRSHIDVVPTILDLMGVTSEDHSLHGKSLVADIDAAPNAPLEERDVYMDMPEGPYNEMRRAIITGASPGTKLIDFGGGRYELFDLGADPAEAKNLTADHARLREARDAMTRLRAGLTERPPSR